MNVSTLSKFAPIHAQAILTDDRNSHHGFNQARGVCTNIWYDTVGCVTRTMANPNSHFVIIGGMFAPPLSVLTFSTRMERYRRDLERLKDGWAGPGSVAPSSAVLADLDRVLAELPEHYDIPEVEVDPDSGHVTLRWQAQGAQEALAFVISGSRQVLAITTLLGAEPTVASRRFDVAHNDSIARFVERNDHIAKVLVHG